MQAVTNVVSICKTDVALCAAIGLQSDDNVSWRSTRLCASSCTKGESFDCTLRMKSLAITVGIVELCTKI